jgi:hypothetical protein
MVQDQLYGTGRETAWQQSSAWTCASYRLTGPIVSVSNSETPEAEGNSMDEGASDAVPDANAETIITKRLYKLPASRQVESLSTITPTEHRRKLLYSRNNGTLINRQTRRTTGGAPTKQGIQNREHEVKEETYPRT